VVNFDFPATSSLYLHRAGRTARMGKSGEVLSLVHASEMRFARSIKEAIERKAELHVVRKGDHLERKRLVSGRTTGKALVRDALSQEAKLLRRDRRRRRGAARGVSRPKKAPPGVPGWRVNKHYR